jgi:hypothetical protein
LRTGVFSSRSQYKTKFDPMKPQPPVTKIVFSIVFRRMPLQCRATSNHRKNAQAILIVIEKAGCSIQPDRCVENSAFIRLASSQSHLLWRFPTALAYTEEDCHDQPPNDCWIAAPSPIHRSTRPRPGPQFQDIDTALEPAAARAAPPALERSHPIAGTAAFVLGHSRFRAQKEILPRPPVPDSPECRWQARIGLHPLLRAMRATPPQQDFHVGFI